MTEHTFVARTGVLVMDDFRDNLIIDRYDPVFSGMRASKVKHLRSENSEDAVTWNVFRSLRQVAPTVWLPPLFAAAFNGTATPDPRHATVELWASVPPPPGLLLGGDEGDSEVDVLIQAPGWVWLIEAKFRSDISTGTTTRPLRDQVLRNIDVGSYFAGVRQFYFSLLIADRKRSTLGVEAVAKYSDLTHTRKLLEDHRPDGLQNLRGLGVLEWRQLGDVLALAATGAAHEDERAIARRAHDWLVAKGLAGGAPD